MSHECRAGRLDDGRVERCSDPRPGPRPAPKDGGLSADFGIGTLTLQGPEPDPAAGRRILGPGIDGPALKGEVVNHIEDLLKASIAEVCGIDVATLRPDSRLEDIGVDSLASAEVLVDLEIRIGRQLPSGTLRRLETAHTVADVAALLRGAFEAPAQGRA